MYIWICCQGWIPSNIPSIIYNWTLESWKVCFDNFLRIGKEPANHQKALHSGKSSWNPKWRCGSDDSPFQLGEFLVLCFNFQGCKCMDLFHLFGCWEIFHRTQNWKRSFRARYWGDDCHVSTLPNLQTFEVH